MTNIKVVRHLYKMLIMFLVNHVFVGTWFFKTKRYLLNSMGGGDRKISVGKGSKIVGPIICTAHLNIGKNCWIGKNLRIHGNGSVRIGDNCDIAPDVVFITGGHRIGSHYRRAGEGESYSIHIGNGTWIGARSTILRDVNIGEGCVIASCSCVIKDIGDDLLMGGVPAKAIRKLE